MPQLATLDYKLADFSAAGAIAKFLEQEKRDQLNITKLAESFKTPWAKREDPLRSAVALIEVRSLGLVLIKEDPFGDELSAALRADLGDWRQPIILDNVSMLDAGNRIDLYVERGLDRSLADFPEPVFAENLERAGLTEENYFLDAYEFVPAPESPEEAACLKRGTVCYDMLQRLEIALRTFIQALMVKQYGPDWSKVRMKEMHEAWEEKAATSRKYGREVTQLIDMADFTDYEKIICKRDHFNEVFKPFFRRKESASESLQRIHPIRLATAHARAPTKEDVMLLAAESARMFRLIKSI